MKSYWRNVILDYLYLWYRLTLVNLTNLWLIYFSNKWTTFSLLLSSSSPVNTNSAGIRSIMSGEKLTTPSPIAPCDMDVDDVQPDRLSVEPKNLMKVRWSICSWQLAIILCYCLTIVISKDVGNLLQFFDILGCSAFNARQLYCIYSFL